jgi:hypothetical protein
MSRAWRRVAAEVALLIAVGLFLGEIGPFGTAAMPDARRYIYWLLNIVGGGVIGIAIDESLGRRLGATWRRVALDSLAMTLPVTALVAGVDRLVNGDAGGLPHPVRLAWQVLVISAAVMSLRALVWRLPRVETRTVIAPPLPGAEDAFRRRLSAKRRAARLIAVEAHDHFLRVHTDAGVELVTMRFADALAELAVRAGLQTHRSWWIAADAIEAVRWRRGAGEARLAGEVLAPVSRTYARALKEAGWF